MSSGHLQGLRRPLEVGQSTHRRVEERLGLRFPRAAAFLARALWRLLRGRLILALGARFSRLSLEAINRGDYEAGFILFHPEAEVIVPPDLAGLGFERKTRGRDARIELQRRWHAEWGDFRVLPASIVGLGDDRILLIGRVSGSGLTSGAAADSEWANLLTISGGMAIREQFFMDHAQAFDAARG
jgi:ketosteroid isomerase-like protein